MANALSILLTLLLMAGVFGMLLLWIVALVQVLKRQDLKESKVLWIILLLFVPGIGQLAYFFSEQRKKLGWWAVVCVLAIVLPLSLISFVISAIAT